MEAATASSSVAIVRPSTEASTQTVFDDDSTRHYAITAYQLPKSTLSSPPLSPVAPSSSGSGGSGDAGLGMKEGKNMGTRFHEDMGTRFHEDMGHEAETRSELPTTCPRLRSSRVTFYRGKGQECLGALERISGEREEEKKQQKKKKQPLRLLDLPVDILKEIVKEITHTNDLTSLAICHSALHGLTIPHIYSRFDIVWPDTSVHSEPRSGVDALTYGLATLVMAEEVFAEVPGQRTEHSSSNNLRVRTGKGRASESTIRRRRGNHYAQFTKKFSLGNGPTDWVQEYLITKEGGKMLGTLVALAVARMRSLQTFIWDMPTGILRDVWLSLSSLADRAELDGRPCRLEKVWVRWHDNSSANDQNPSISPPPLSMPLHNSLVPPPLQGGTSSGTAAMPAPPPPQIHPAALDRVQHPSFSVLPPLKSLSVLDIDELPYLDEMAVLIATSLEKLRELRVGIARHAMSKEWVTVWEGDNLPQVDPEYPTAASLTIGEKRQGGVLGALTGFVCDMRKPRVVRPDRTAKKRAQAKAPPPTPSPPVPEREESDGLDPITEALNAVTGTSTRTLPDLVPGGSIPPTAQSPSHRTPAEGSLSPDGAAREDSDPLVAMSRQASPTLGRQDLIPAPPLTAKSKEEPNTRTSKHAEPAREYLDNILHLESLELERVPLSIPVLQRALDWTRLTSLTVLHCQSHEQLWKTLRRDFAPVFKSPTYRTAHRTPSSTPRKGSKAAVSNLDVELEYGLNLKKVHTNNVSPALIAFLKETLAPNSLQVLFLQDARTYVSSVSVDQIFRGPIRRHRSSLKKVLIDSSEKGADGLPTNSSRWRRWIIGREILSFMCGGKMPALRELGVTLDYRDWHFFLQHLPSIPHLRSLYIPFLADHVHGTNVDPRELALQIVDIVALRPEVELCYMGIANKCFEILENKRDSESRPESHLGTGGGGVIEDAGESEDEGEDEDEDEGEGDEDEGDGEEVVEEETETDDEIEDSDAESVVDADRHAARLRLREILFYDDKVAIFKARHGRL